MKPLTFFNAYAEAERQKHIIAQLRGRDGILTAHDEFARAFQRRNRQAIKFRRRYGQMLGTGERTYPQEIDEHDVADILVIPYPHIVRKMCQKGLLKHRKCKDKYLFDRDYILRVSTHGVGHVDWELVATQSFKEPISA